jgi:hypothetical protein
MTDVVGPDAERMAEGVIGMAPANDSLNIFGRDTEGHAIRYFWEPDFGGDWIAENITIESILV